MTKEPNAAAGLKSAHPFMGPFINMVLLPGRRKIRIGQFVTKQHPIAIQNHMGHKSPPIRQGHPTLLHRWGGRPGGDGHIKGLLGRLNILCHIDMGNIQRIGIFVESMGHSVGGKIPLEGNSGKIEKITNRVFILRAG